ncbi:MAG: hypothetical protein II929_04230 [Succinivibrio sp.]|nr:hypothetical protein [Succinivibrio sp.]
MSDQNKPVNYAAELNREMEILDYKSMMQQEREKGREETTLKILRNMLQYSHSADEALRQMGIPEDQWESLKENLS